MARAGFVDSVLRAGSRAWRRVAPASMRGLAGPLMAAVAQQRVFAAIARGEPEPSPGPLVVSGFLSETRGISQAARLTVKGLEAAGYAPIAHDLRPLLDAGPGKRTALPSGPGGVWIAHANAPEAMQALGYLDPASWLGRYRIGYWVYELPKVPDAWVRISQAFHEIWTPSRFSAEALLASGVKTPVRVMPHPVALGRIKAAPDRARFGIPASAFAVLAMGDLRSSAARKNLLGAIEIYARAFPEADGNQRLIVKVQATDPDPPFQASLEKIAGGRSDIIWLSETLSLSDTHKLIASSDLLLSPHRAEGFGLPLAEAFLLDRPALATGWSGNLDFMDDLGELLIGHTLAPVHDPSGIYRAPGQVWAEPDLADAVNKLRALAGSPELRANLAARGRKAVENLGAAWSRETLSGSAVQRFMVT